jgi:hypothetical protein
LSIFTVLTTLDSIFSQKRDFLSGGASPSSEYNYLKVRSFLSSLLFIENPSKFMAFGFSVMSEPSATFDQILCKVPLFTISYSFCRYLIEEKKGGQPLDPVCNFHLRNGALIERINWMADLSELRLSESAGMMVNYLYPLSEIDTNYQAYLRGQVSLSPQLKTFTTEAGFT